MVYRDDELQKLHEILLMMLKDFDKVCQENHIQYFLGGGTLLGAVRHGGFIPWDDDIDLMMTREQYDKLCSLPRKAFPPHLFLQTYRTDPEYHGDMAKVRLNGTEFVTRFSSCFPQMHQGIFLDIFAHDKTSSKLWGQKIHIFLTALTRSMVFHKWERTAMQYYGHHKIACRLCTWCIKLLPMIFLEYLREKCLRMFSKSQSAFLYDGMGMHLQHGAFPEYWLENVIQTEFEENLYPIPKEYDKYLKYSYGNYRRIPDSDKQKIHQIVKLRFGKY